MYFTKDSLHYLLEVLKAHEYVHLYSKDEMRKLEILRASAKNALEKLGSGSKVLKGRSTGSLGMLTVQRQVKNHIKFSEGLKEEEPTATFSTCFVVNFYQVMGYKISEIEGTFLTRHNHFMKFKKIVIATACLYRYVGLFSHVPALSTFLGLSVEIKETYSKNKKAGAYSIASRTKRRLIDNHVLTVNNP